MKVTIRQIAEIANVSRGTVDKVLNNRPGVSDAVRERVKKVANALNYQPNIIGKALARQHDPKKIGIIVAPDYNPFVKDIKLGIDTARTEIADYGCQVDMRVLNTLEAQEQLNILNNFIENGIDAVAMFSIDSEEIRKKVNEIVAMGKPVVTYNSDIHDSKRMCYVGQDHFRGGVVAADLMSKVLGSGADALVITSLMELECHRERIAGFKAGLKQFGSHINVVEIVENQDKSEIAFALTLKKLEEYPNIHGVYITGGGVSGVGEALKMLGKEKDIRVICHDLVESTASLVREGVVDFTIGQDPFFQGYQSVKILFDYLIAGRQPEEEFIRTRIDIRSRSTI
jgi:LacI family transcriptional regulator